MKKDVDDPAIDGCEQIRMAAFAAVRYDEMRRGPLPRCDAADLGAEAAEITWIAIKSSQELIQAIDGKRDPLNWDETRHWVDLIFRYFKGENDDLKLESILSSDQATMLIDQAFLVENRATSLHRAVGTFAKGTISRLIDHYRKRPKVEDGSTYDGKRRRRLLKADESLADNAGAVMSKDSGSSTDAMLDGRMAFAQLSDLERAICLAHFVDDETLQELLSYSWPEHGQMSLHQIRKIRDQAVKHIERVLGPDYKLTTIPRG